MTGTADGRPACAAGAPGRPRAARVDVHHDARRERHSVSGAVRGEPQRRVDRGQAAVCGLLQIHVSVARRGPRAISAAWCGSWPQSTGFRASISTTSAIRTSSFRWRSRRGTTSFRTRSIRTSTSAIATCAVRVRTSEWRRSDGYPLRPDIGAWRQYRYDTITAVVAQLADVTHRAGKLLTAAVFPTPDIARTLVRQDWTKWKLDAALPMVYNGFYKEGVPWVERATSEGVRALAGRIPLYSGSTFPICRRPTWLRRSSARLLAVPAA